MRNLFYYLACLILLAECRKPENAEYSGMGQVKLVFNHTVKGKPLILDSMAYHTATGYEYQIAVLQYFISDVTLYHNGGKPVILGSDEGIHYVDPREPATLSWNLKDGIKPGTYDSIVFTFGINAVKNISGSFPNPPERDMAWPEILGGGYHYMKMNLMYRNPQNAQTVPFMFHLGIGQQYSSELPDPDSITGYIQNNFPVTLNTGFGVAGGAIRTIQCTMLVDRWFDGVETFDFNDYPAGIMQYQQGMEKACINGRKAFSGSVLN